MGVYKRSISTAELQDNPKLFPVRIAKGALGNGLPQRDLLVSRQHRMLAASPIVQRMFETSEVLVSAILLTDLPDIAVDDQVSNVTYFHIVFEEHQVIFAEGAPTESLLLNTEALKSLPCAVRDELEAILPVLCQGPITASARQIPERPRQKKMCERHAKNARYLLASFETQNRKTEHVGVTAK